MAANRETRRADASDKKRGADARGVIRLDLGFRTLKLKMTLAAIADCEDAFDMDDFGDIEAVLTNTKKIAKFIGILARAAGEEVNAEDEEKIRRAPITIPEFIEALQAALGVEPGPQPPTPAPSA